MDRFELLGPLPREGTTPPTALVVALSDLLDRGRLQS